MVTVSVSDSLDQRRSAETGTVAMHSQTFLPSPFFLLFTTAPSFSFSTFQSAFSSSRVMAFSKATATVASSWGREGGGLSNL